MFENFLYTVQHIWSMGFVRFIVLLVLGFLAAKIVSGLVTKLLKVLKLDQKLDKWGINEGTVGTSSQFIGKLVYLIVFLCFLSGALEAIGIVVISEPISRFVTSFVGYIPNIVAAVIIVYVGNLVAKILGQIVSVLLKKTKIDSLIKKTDGEEKNPVVLSDVLTKIITTAIILVAIVSALSILRIEAVSAPAISIVHTIFAAIPKIILAVIVVAVGMLVANLACSLLLNVLVAVNFDKVVKKVLPQLKASAAKVIVNVVKVIIVIFVAAQGLQALDLSFFTMLAAEIIAYLPLVIKAAVILLLAFIGANMLETLLAKTCPKACCVGKIAKVGIFTVAGFMILSQLGIAPEIVNTAFVVVISAIAVSFALAFGLGGKDFAKKVLDKADQKLVEKE